MARELVHLESSASTLNQSSLLGLDAKIPGGKYDQ